MTSLTNIEDKSLALLFKISVFKLFCRHSTLHSWRAYLIDKQTQLAAYELDEALGHHMTAQRRIRSLS